MKDKIIIFIIGLLLGAIISTASIFAYTKAESKDNNSNMNSIQMNGNPPSMPGGNGMGEPPTRPGDNNTQANIN